MVLKRVLLSLSIIGALIISQSAWADNSNRKYGRGYGIDFNFSYEHYYPRHRGYDSGSFLSGLVLGSLLNSSRHSSRNVETVVYRSPSTISTREIVYDDRAQTLSAAAPVASGRHLLRDLEGNCFERIVDEQGDEIRVQLEAQECNF